MKILIDTEEANENEIKILLKYLDSNMWNYAEVRK